MLEATMKLGVSRQTVLQRVKRGELEAVLLTRGKTEWLAHQSDRHSTQALS